MPPTQPSQPDDLQPLIHALVTFLTNLTNAQTGREEAEAATVLFKKGIRDQALRCLQAAKQARPALIALLEKSGQPLEALRHTLGTMDVVSESAQHLAYDFYTPLPAAEFSVRTYNALSKVHITTIRQLCALQLRDLLPLRNLGEKGVAEIVAYRARLGVPLNA